MGFQPNVTCFMIQPTKRARRWYRRYCSGQCPLHPGEYSHHEAMVLAPDARLRESERGHSVEQLVDDDPLWPATCACGHPFGVSDIKQTFFVQIYLTPDQTEVHIHARASRPGIRPAPPGAMFYADWNLVDGSDRYRGPDNHCLAVVCPDGSTWLIDGECNNCTRVGDAAHKCWCRHGTPPLITVDKNCDTCEAGAGSIQTSNYHGMLANGKFSP